MKLCYVVVGIASARCRYPRYVGVRDGPPRRVVLSPLSRYHAQMSLRTALAALPILLLTVVGCSQSSTDVARSTTDAGVAPVAVQLNWYPEAEHGGVYQAQATGLYKAASLAVEIRPGGRATPVGPELSMGRCEFAFANADDVVLFRQQGADVVAVLAAMQNHPRCILVRADSGVERLEDLKGMTLQRQAGRPFLAFLEKRKLLEGVRQVPYNGSVADLVRSPDVAIQAYSFAEPLLAQQQGVEVRTLMISDLGWNPYSSVLVTTGELIRRRPERVRAMVQATQRGWQSYLTDPVPGNRLILEANQHGMTAETLQFGAAQLRELAMPPGTPIEQVGRMSLDRWTTLVQQMADLDLVDPAVVSPQSCFTTEFLLPNESP